MNYLAHLLLARDDGDVVVGSLLGDFLRGPVPTWLPSGIATGVRLHRAVDAYTDHHPLFRRSVARTPPPLRRYGPIIIDLYYDHLLARNWPRYHSDSLEEFSGRTYALLMSRLADLPPDARHRITGIIEADLLPSYRRLATVEVALRRVGARLRQPRDLALALPELRRQAQVLEQDFRGFFPELRAHSDALLQEGSLRTPQL